MERDFDEGELMYRPGSTVEETVDPGEVIDVKPTAVVPRELTARELDIQRTEKELNVDSIMEEFETDSIKDAEIAEQRESEITLRNKLISQSLRAIIESKTKQDETLNDAIVDENNDTFRIHDVGLESDKEIRAKPVLPDYLSDFELVKRIGEGSTRAVDLLIQHTGSEFAYKTLRPRAIEEARAKGGNKVIDLHNAMKVEAGLIARMGRRHPEHFPNFVIDYTTREDPGFLTEFLPESLEEKIENGMSMKEMVAHFVHISKGVQKLHEQDIVWGDIKSENLRVSYNGKVKISDLDLKTVQGVIESSMLQSMNLSQTEGKVQGTARNMAPEQWEGKADVRTDVLLLSRLGYEIFSGGLKPALNFPDLVELNPEAGKLHEVFKKGMSQRPEDRYQTIGELLDAVTESLGERGLSETTEHSFDTSSGEVKGLERIVGSSKADKELLARVYETDKRSMSVRAIEHAERLSEMPANKNNESKRQYIIDNVLTTVDATKYELQITTPEISYVSVRQEKGRGKLGSIFVRDPDTNKWVMKKMDVTQQSKMSKAFQELVVKTGIYFDQEMNEREKAMDAILSRNVHGGLDEKVERVMDDRELRRRAGESTKRLYAHCEGGSCSGFYGNGNHISFEIDGINIEVIGKKFGDPFRGKELKLATPDVTYVSTGRWIEGNLAKLSHIEVKDKQNLKNGVKRKLYSEEFDNAQRAYQTLLIKAGEQLRERDGKVAEKISDVLDERSGEGESARSLEEQAREVGLRLIKAGIDSSEKDITLNERNISICISSLYSWRDGIKITDGHIEYFGIGGKRNCGKLNVVSIIDPLTNRRNRKSLSDSEFKEAEKTYQNLLVGIGQNYDGEIRKIEERARQNTMMDSNGGKE